ncbi:MAG TPA: hypothetical protein VG433_07345 [Pirellulales bacterium]|nr:hypothetical protein [Pirellulales bacterium]
MVVEGKEHALGCRELRGETENRGKQDRDSFHAIAGAKKWRDERAGRQAESR